MTPFSETRCRDALEAIITASCDVDGLLSVEMLTALGYLAGQVIRCAPNPEETLAQFIASLQRHVRHGAPALH